MARVWYLDRVLDLNTEYRLDDRVAFIIRKIGTDVSDSITLTVDNIPSVPFHGDFAPINYTDSNTLGLLDLGDYFFVIPNDSKFKFESGSSGKVRVVGELWILDAGERLSSEYLQRLKEQNYRGISFKANTVSTSGATWGAGEELTLISVEPGVLEKYTLDDVVMIKFGNADISWGQIGIHFKVDDQLIEFITDQGARFGIDALAFPYPPSQTNGWYPFSLKDTPFRLTYGHKFEVLARNVSGSDISSADGTNPISVSVMIKLKYEKTPYSGVS